jgi:hypothetical protein
MATDFIYPTSADLNEIARDKLPMLVADRPIFAYFPIRDHEATLVEWEQRDNYSGLQQIRGINGQAPSVQKTGVRRFADQPGVYGEYSILDEQELTNRRAPGQFGAPMDISDMVMDVQDQLLQRRLDRQEALIWTLCATGTFSVLGKDNAIVHTSTYLRQTYSAFASWSSFSTATPLADFSGVQLLARGHSVNFGSGAKAFMNRKTFNNLRSNTNAADIYGRRTTGLGTVNSLAQWNELLSQDDLPEIVIYDAGYLVDGSVNPFATDMTQFGVFTPFIPDNTVIVFGQRPGNQPIGQMMQTRNVENGGAPGPYMKVIDTIDRKVPRTIEVHDGFNGGPTIEYPSALVVMAV